MIENRKVTRELMGNYLKTFYAFIDENMDFSIALYPESLEATPEDNNFYAAYRRLTGRLLHNTDRKKGILLEDIDAPEKSADENSIDMAIRFVKKNQIGRAHV